jgi:hypothetical protein
VETGLSESPGYRRSDALTGDDRYLIRMLARRCLTGIIASWTLLLGLVWSDVGQIGSLMDRSEIGWIGYLMLAVAFATTGGAIGMGVAVSSIGRGR